MAQTVVAVFDNHAAAIEGVHQLREDGFLPGQISIFAPDAREVEGFADELGVRVIQASTTGALAGGALGGLSGWILGAATLEIPGVGHVVAAGAILGAIVGALGGSTVGGFIGMLVGFG